MLEHQRKGTNQPFWNTSVADNSELIKEFLGPWWKASRAAYGKAIAAVSAGGMTFLWGEKKSWKWYQEEKELARTCLHLYVVLSLHLNTMTFRAQWLLLPFCIPSLAQVSFLISFNLEPYREGSSGEHICSLAKLTQTGCDKAHDQCL